MSRSALCVLLLVSLLCLCGFSQHGTPSYVELAQMFEANGDHEIALLCYNRAVEKAPQVADNYLSRAFFLLKEGRADDGIRDLSTFISLTPDKPEGYLSRGLVHSERNEKELARQDFSMACRLGDQSGCTFLGEPSP